MKAERKEIKTPITVMVGTRLLEENDRLAAANRQAFSQRGLCCLNLISSPGSGKTTLLVETIRALEGNLRVAVIEGDQHTDHDARMIASTGAEVVQINTGQACHLDAGMVATAAERLDMEGADLLIIENVGNLICPAEYDLGEDAKVVLMSVTEGEEKPVKYPLIFHLASAVVLTKCDLLPHLRFDMSTCLANIRQVNPQAAILQTSAFQPDGLRDWLAWIEKQVRQ
jgi:hydrogenase nickel incorporation protein HypB